MSTDWPVVTGGELANNSDSGERSSSFSTASPLGVLDSLTDDTSHEGKMTVSHSESEPGSLTQKIIRLFVPRLKSIQNCEYLTSLGLKTSI